METKEQYKQEGIDNKIKEVENIIQDFQSPIDYFEDYSFSPFKAIDRLDQGEKQKYYIQIMKEFIIYTWSLLGKSNSENFIILNEMLNLAEIERIEEEFQRNLTKMNNIKNTTENSLRNLFLE